MNKMITLTIQGEKITKNESYWRNRIDTLRSSKFMSIQYLGDTIEEGLEIQLKKLERENND